MVSITNIVRKILLDFREKKFEKRKIIQLFCEVVIIGEKPPDLKKIYIIYKRTTK